MDDHWPMDGGCQLFSPGTYLNQFHLYSGAEHVQIALAAFCDAGTQRE